MTRGVEGTLSERRDMVKVKGGSAGQRMAPKTMRLRQSKPEGQKQFVGEEWRCLSRREERTLATCGFKREEWS